MGATEVTVATTHADQVRQRILDGAARAFSVSGFQGTSVPQIAGEVGVSVGLLYRYFPSKANLFTAICMSELESEIESLTRQLSEISDPTERLRQGVEFYLRQMEQKQSAGVILGALAEAPANNEVREVMRLRATTIRDFVRGYLEEGVKAGEVPATTPIEEFTQAIAMMLDGVVTAWAISGPELDLGAVRDAIVSLLAAALQTPGRREP
ncbi:MAG TPA: TetR/AcrR family transcriptional regulator [Candidatus Dormibacteraeota bacterium]|nr:TetR/AcrR family transcriptional regulator [Candidatus Dormibacteraeota bacterium]